MAAPGKRVAALVLRRLRRARSKGAIISALVEIEFETDALKLHELPPLLRIVNVSRNFCELVDVYGVERFFMNWPHPYVAYTTDAIEWYRTIGATRAARYLEQGSALFPKGKPPVEYSEAQDAVDRIQARRPSAFKDLDRKFRGATTELARRMRTYLLSHQEDLKNELVHGEAVAEEARTLPAVLAVKDDVEFLDAAREMARHAEGLANAPDWLTEERNAANLLLILRALYVDVSVEGIWKFLNSPIGSLTHDVERWCRALGAKRAAAYLADTAKLFPRGRVPLDEDRRFDVVEGLSEKAGPGNLDPLGKLDRKYAGAVDEMVDSLRTYLRAHAENPIKALEKLARSR